MLYKLYEWRGKTDANLGQEPDEEIDLYLIVAEDGSQYSLVPEDNIDLPEGLQPTAEFVSEQNL